MKPRLLATFPRALSRSNPTLSSPVLHTRPPIRTQSRTLIAAPKPNSGPLLSRHPDRDLPDINSPLKNWLITLPIFTLLVGASALAIFNYEKSSSSVVNSTLYSLRTHPEARGLLGDEIYFRSRWPWIWGELNLVHGRIDIGYGVKGTMGSGYMRFKADRATRSGFFETREWELEVLEGPARGRVVRLLGEEGRDPFGKEVQEAA